MVLFLRNGGPPSEIIIKIRVVLLQRNTGTVRAKRWYIFVRNNHLIVVIINSSLLSSIIYMFSIVIDCMIPNALKYMFVYFCFPLPGETIFSRMLIKVKDKRFTQQQVKEQYDELYRNLSGLNKEEKRRYENSKWYGLSCKYDKNSRVITTHRDFLMTRDFTSLSVILFFIYLSMTFFRIVLFSWTVVLYLIFVYLICNIATRVKGKRFVSTVIACDIVLEDN